MNRYVKYGLIIPLITNIILYSYFFGGDYFPPINDPAIWIKYANGVFGYTYPLWDTTPFQYPPLFPFILGAFKFLIGDYLLALKILGIFLASIISLSVYPLARYLSNSEVGGLVAVWIVGFHPVFYEMFGWGGYPNLLALIFLSLSTYYLLRFIDEPKTKNLVLSSILIALTVFTHHLTTLVLFMVVSAYLLYIVLIGRSEIGYPKIYMFIPMFVSIASFISWRLLSGPFQYIIYNLSSLVIRPFDETAFFWMFKTSVLAYLTVILAVSGGIALYIYGRYKELFIISTWAVFPFLFTQAYLFGIALDYKRFPMMSIPALAVLIASNILFLRDGWIEIQGKRRVSIETDKALLSSLIIILVSSNVAVGFGMPYKVDDYYHYLLDYAYGNIEKYDLLSWIMENTSRYDVFVADESMGRWIEGYAGRRVVLQLPPYQSFLVGEVERYIVSSQVLYTNIMLMNEYVRVMDDIPYLYNRTPWIGVSNGLDYENIVYLVDGTVTISFEYMGSVWIESPYGSEITSLQWLERSDEEAVYQVIYRSKSLEIIKEVKLVKSSRTVEISYNVSPIIDASLINMSVPIWIPFKKSISNPLYLNDKLYLNIDGQQLILESNGDSTVGVDMKWGQKRILLTFNASDNRLAGYIRMTFPYAEKSFWNSGLWAYDTDELISMYNIKYIVLSKAKDNYIRFILDDRMAPVYENEKLIVFMVSR